MPQDVSSLCIFKVIPSVIRDREPVGSASSLKYAAHTPHFYAFNIETRQAEKHWLDVIAFLN
jgi:hypothetical protein